MPFGWNQEPNAAVPRSSRLENNTRSSPSRSLSASHRHTIYGESPTSFRRGHIPHSASISSNLSIASSSRSNVPAPSSFTINKGTSSTALTTTDDSDDFRRFLDEAHAQDQLRRDSSSGSRQQPRPLGVSDAPKRPAGPAPVAGRSGTAADSLRRAASSSTLRSQRAAQATTLDPNSNAAATSTAPLRFRNDNHAAAPPGRVRKDSTYSTLSAAPRSVSNFSTSFRNPTSQFLQQLSSEAQRPELGLDDTPIVGRAVDNKSHLTALGHAAQIQSRNASASAHNATIKGKGKAREPTPSPKLPTRASTAPAVPSSSTRPPASSSFGPSVGTLAEPSVAPPASSPTFRRQPLSPIRRPQSYIHRPPSEPSGTISTRQLGKPTHLGLGLPSPLENSKHNSTNSRSSSSSNMTKRSADEMDAVTHPTTSLEPATPEQDKLQITPSPASQSSSASRRRTWFGLGRVQEPEEPAKPKEAEPTKPVPVTAASAEPVSSSNDEAPPPMSEEEAEFRRSLGIDATYNAAAVQKTTDESSLQPRPFPVSRDSDSTIRGAPLPPSQSTVARERRVSWLPWRNVSGPLQDAEDAQAGAKQEPQKTSDGVPPAIAESTESAELQGRDTGATQTEAKQTELAQQPASAETEAEKETVKYRTVLKRGWLGARYEVQEPVQDLQHMFDNDGKMPAAVELRPEATSDSSDALKRTVSKDNTTPAGQDATSAETAYPPGKDDDRTEQRQTSSSAWRWTIWGGAGPAPAAKSVDTSGTPDAAADTAPPARDINQDAHSSSGEPADSKCQPMEIDGQQHDGNSLSPTQSSDSWTYSSYVASWVPTWVYNAQQQQQQQQGQAVDQAAVSGDDVTMANGETDADDTTPVATPTAEQPRTPAEQVKADALARDSSPTLFDANKAVLNESTRSGWIKFFGSKSANPPKPMPDMITDRDESGLEVMDISDMDDAIGRTSSTARSTAGKASSRQPTAAASARDIANSKSNEAAKRGRTTPSTTRPGSSGTTPRASSLLGAEDAPRPSTPLLSTSKDSINLLSKAALTKAANATAASSVGLGKGKRADAGGSNGSGNQQVNGSSAYGSSNGNGNNNGKENGTAKGLAPDEGGPSRSGASTPTRATQDASRRIAPNLVLPAFDDTFLRAPRMWPPKVSMLERTLSAVNSYLFSKVPDFERMKRPTRFSTYGSDATLTIGGNNSGNSAGSDSNANGGTGAGTLRSRRSGQHLAGKAKATGLGSSKDKGVEQSLKDVAESAQRLPRAWAAVGLPERAQTRGTMGIAKIVVIGVHGWFTQSIFKNMIGEPTGTSAKFATMQTESIRRHFLEAGLELNPEAITVISLQGDGKVADRVDRLFAELISRPHWVKDLREADALFLSAHSQGAVVATQLLARLIEQRHVAAERTRICLLAMCGIHHGPFAHLKSSLTTSYLHYFETAAAKELFEFQSSTTPVAQQYTAALKIILDAGTKCVYVGSTDDNVVPIYSALNSSNNHPSILRALYIDGQAFPKVDFLTNLLVLCVAVRNAGLNDHNLLTLLSSSVAGSLYGGRGHSNVYEERAVYDLATRYLFEVTHPLSEPTLVPGHRAGPTNNNGTMAPASPQRKGSSSVSSGTMGAASGGAVAMVAQGSSAGEADAKRTPVLVSEAFEAQRWNPYELPWSLRGFFEDKHVRSLFAEDILDLLNSYEEWRPDPKSKALKDLQWRLAPMRSIARPMIEEDAGAGPYDIADSNNDANAHSSNGGQSNDASSASSKNAKL
ncbi:hypothetical protein BCV70DRAFT_200417 [Testicularia cyperi]|uniref:YMC020W-like alpha/beta hydrolase domain-containing protein n=1 Tax=Testicularia cyperi TaxID=1882483 RepID=A0A317XSI3_9BASI|nr:hypothetical protein BCV70DRAFT_200417 [Testicularia cyperi]